MLWCLNYSPSPFASRFLNEILGEMRVYGGKTSHILAVSSENRTECALEAVERFEKKHSSEPIKPTHNQTKRSQGGPAEAI